MLERLLSHPIIHIATIGAVLLGVFLCVFPDAVPPLSWVVNYAVQLMLFYLVAGLIVLFLKQPRLTFSFFGGCVLLCFYLKYSANMDGIERLRQQMVQGHKNDNDAPHTFISDLKIAHINLTNVNSHEEVPTVVRAIGADIVFFHEVTPNWETLLQDSFAHSHPFNHTMLDIGLYGMSVFSKFKLVDIDTLYFNEIPNLSGQVEVDKNSFSFLSVHTQPALDEFSKKRLHEHLGLIEKKAARTEGPMLVIGEFNAVSWSDQIKVFLNQTNLMESRTGFMPTSISGKISIWDLPLDHIFYSGEFICTNFQNIEGELGQHLGILGTYHFLKEHSHAKKTAQ
jgi:endonuclease/exonuclease/phosphatase family metal-dependent hydrolase